MRITPPLLEVPYSKYHVLSLAAKVIGDCNLKSVFEKTFLTLSSHEG